MAPHAHGVAHSTLGWRCEPSLVAASLPTEHLDQRDSSHGKNNDSYQKLGDVSIHTDVLENGTLFSLFAKEAS